MREWQGDPSLAELVRSKWDQCLAAYRANETLVEQDSNIEISNVEGGYGRKQVNELVQNAADALSGTSGRVALVLTGSHLYCANEGGALSAEGLNTLLHSHLSLKRDEQIGRFGLGFKSMLGVTNRPEIFSRSVSVRFDRDLARSVIREIVPTANRTPVLRLAEVVDAWAAARDDHVLAQLMVWATTVVRLPLGRDTEWLHEKVSEFPPEFMLFSPQVAGLELVTTTESTVWTARRAGINVELDNASSRAYRWKVFTENHNPSPEAIADAGEISGRYQLPVTWAVPTKGKGGIGQFWSHFPTQSQTTLSGIVNAPFKTNEDRTDLLRGLYNKETLTKALPALIGRNLQYLASTEDPGSILEIVPARGKEPRSWADGVINEPVVAAIAAQRCLPDMDGQLRMIRDLDFPPEILSDHSSWVERWASTPGRPVAWLHPTAYRQTERKHKAFRLMGLGGKKPAGLGRWLSDLAESGIPGAMTAVYLASQIDAKGSTEDMKEMRQCRVVLTGAKTLVQPISGKVFLPDSPDDVGADYVHSDLVADVEALAALKLLGIDRLDVKGKLQRQIQATIQRQRGDEVERLWMLAGELPADAAANILIKGFGPGNTPVRTLASKPAPIADVLLPGVVVPADSSRDASVTIDMSFHADDREILRLLGAASAPFVGRSFEHEHWYREWLAAARAEYMTQARAAGRKVTTEQILVRPGERTAARLDVLPKLSDEGKIAFTSSVIAAATADWQIDSTTKALGRPMSFANPGIWWVRRHGMIKTSYGPQAPERTFLHSPTTPDDLFPSARMDRDVARTLGLRTSMSHTDWGWLLTTANSVLPLDRLHRLYGLAAITDAAPPEYVKVSRAGSSYMVPPDDCTVTHDDTEYAALVAAGFDVVLAPTAEASVALQSSWSLRDGAGLVHRTVLAARSGESTPLVDMFAGLRHVRTGLEGYELVPCSELATEISTDDDTQSVSTAHQLLVDGTVVYFRDHLQNGDLLREVSAGLRLDLAAEEVARILDIRDRAAQNSRVRAVQKASSDAERLVVLAGSDGVRGAVSKDAIETAERRSGQKLTDIDVAEMAIASTGGDVLIKKLTTAIEANGFDVPTRLGGSTSARSTMKQWGLSEEFAGHRVESPPASISIMGPISLPKLHDYQEETVQRIARLLADGSGKRRGMVELPTGSGKTRVAVEATIRDLKRDNSTRLILWVAQTEELCEQAAETWSYMWGATGVPAMPLTLSRLWGSNDAAPTDVGTQLVIATDDKLHSLRKRGTYEWLTDAAIVIVDEAHTSVSPTYTALFEWLKRGTRDRSRPLIGLSATPYRGENVDQTSLLVNRYDKNLLTEGVFGSEDPHVYLQARGILANVEHRTLDGIDLLPARGAGEESETVRPGDLTKYRINLDAVAQNAARNDRILDSVIELASETTVLLFAASVQHAEYLAQVLSKEKVAAASVSAYSSVGDRRRIVSEFKTGKIRVLTNYNVLSQGFDAPKVGAVYVARPTFSLNRYQQMIGRGLRGPKNGGSDTVLIVNVKDNADAFGEQLAFHHFDALWNRDSVR